MQIIITVQVLEFKNPIKDLAILYFFIFLLIVHFKTLYVILVVNYFLFNISILKYPKEFLILWHLYYYKKGSACFRRTWNYGFTLSTKLRFCPPFLSLILSAKLRFCPPLLSLPTLSLTLLKYKVIYTFINLLHLFTLFQFIILLWSY